MYILRKNAYFILFVTIELHGWMNALKIKQQITNISKEKNT